MKGLIQELVEREDELLIQKEVVRCMEEKIQIVKNSIEEQVFLGQMSQYLKVDWAAVRRGINNI